MADIRIFRAQSPPTPSDVRELKTFLESPLVEDEKALQQLLERHPQLIGVLGFSEFLSEVPLFKTDAENMPDLSDLRRRDRADLIATESSPLLSSYRAANIIELKGAARPIADRNVGFRLSPDASEAVQQLHEYRQWLTTIPQNRALLTDLNWDIRWPSLFLIMGRSHEFTDNPGQLLEIRSRLIDQGVQLFTADDVLGAAMRHVENRIVPPQVIDWYTVPSYKDGVHGIHLAGALVVKFQQAFQLAMQDPSSLAAMPYRAFEELVGEVYRRLGYAIELTHSSRDGGKDIIATKEMKGISPARLIIECKRCSPSETVGVEAVEELYSVHMQEGSTHAVLVTTGTLSRGARVFADYYKSQLTVFDLSALVALIRSVC
jgi:HJR/Mrr/RecB family endonuclease